MDRSKDDKFRNTFGLPRKGNSAIRITAPTTKTRQPALSPSEELARAFSQDLQLESWPKPGATTSGARDSAVSAPDETHHQPEQGVVKANGDTLQVFKTLSIDEEPAVAPVKAQLAKITIRERDYVRAARKGASSHVKKQSEETQRVHVELPKETVSRSIPSPSQQPTPAPPSTIDPKSSSLDVYAINYIPQYLKAINECPAQIRYSIGLPLINYAQYIASFAGFTLLQPLDPFICPSLDHVPLGEVVHIKDLTQQNYELYLNGRLFHELHAQKIELKEYALHSISFNTADSAKSLYSFIIPGIRESSPRIDLGDIVLVRPWGCVPHEGLAKLAKEWYATNGPKGTKLAPGFPGWEYRAVVWGLQRSKEQVILRLDGFPPSALRICNISFIIQEHKCSPLYSAIARVARMLHLDASPAQWLRCILFPAENDGVLQKTLSKGSFDLPWYDKQLNFEQQKSVDAIIKRQYGGVPFIISGPPGTGKTKTLVEAALQLLRSTATAYERYHLLICAPSDSAADVIATRLQAHLSRRELFRLNGWTRSFAEVPEPLMLYSYIENDLFGIPPFATMMNFKVVVTTCRDAEMLVQARLTNIDLAVLTTQLSVITSSASAQPLRLHWSALLLDEAAQATEAEALIPLTVAQPGAHPSEGFHSLPQFIMAGDEHQLGPRLSLRAPSGLRYTLFQRLFEREIYADHPLSRTKGSKPLTASMLPIIRPPFVNLVRNYRSHPTILTVPSMLFYHDTLIPEVAKTSDAIALWQRWNGALRWPVLFVQNGSQDSVQSLLAGNGTGAGALLNDGEATVAKELVMSLLNPSDSLKPTFPALMPHEITVIAAFRAQVNYLRVAFRSAGLRGVNIGPLEAFQGLESRVVVLCTTRTRLDERDPGRFVRQDQARGIGLIGDVRKFNVALTRAREGLIVIGDAKCLTCTGDEAWAAFIAFCKRNDCVEHAGKEWTSMSSDVPPGRMEKALRYAADAKARNEQTSAALVGFGYATPANGVLRGQLPTEDEAMWADGIRLAEDNEMYDVDEAMWADGIRLAEDNEMYDVDEEECGNVDEDFGQFHVEEEIGSVDENPGQSQRAIDAILDSPTRIAPPTVTVDASGQLISIPNTLGTKSNVHATVSGNASGNIDDTTKLISLSPELERRVAKGKKDMPAAEETVFDRDLETEIKKEGCEMQ